MRHIALSAPALSLLLPLALHGQNPAPPRFEVASVKPSVAGARPNVSQGPGQWNCIGCSLFALFTQAYAVFEYQVKAPEWTRTANFDVLAKIPEGAKREDLRPMLQQLLAERFQLRAHREEPEMAVYELVVANGGLKLQRISSPAAPPPPGPEFDHAGYPNVPGGTGFRTGNGRGRIQFRGQILKNVAHYISMQVDRPVLDATGLEGTYALVLSFRMLPRNANDIASTAGSADLGPTIYEAVEEQLGLKLRPARRKVETIVVESVQKTPTEN